MNILPPFDPGGELGASLGKSLGSGLSSLASMKLQQMQNSETERGLTALGVHPLAARAMSQNPELLKYALPSYLEQYGPSFGEAIDTSLTGQPPQTQASSIGAPSPTQIPMEQPGLQPLKTQAQFFKENPSVAKMAPKLRQRAYEKYEDEYHKRKTEEQAAATLTETKRHHQVLEEQHETAEQRKGVQKFVNDIQKEHQTVVDQIKNAKTIKEMVKSGQLKTGAMYGVLKNVKLPFLGNLGLDRFFRNPTTEAFEKVSSQLGIDALKGLGATGTKSSQRLLEAINMTVPTRANTPEAIDFLADYIINNAEAKNIVFDEVNKIIKSNKNKVPLDISERLAEKVDPILNKKNDELLARLQKLEAISPKETVDTLSNDASQYSDGDIAKQNGKPVARFSGKTGRWEPL